MWLIYLDCLQILRFSDESQHFRPPKPQQTVGFRLDLEWSWVFQEAAGLAGTLNLFLTSLTEG